MTYKEAYEILRDTPIDIRSREDDIHTRYATAQLIALECIEKQIPKKPTKYTLHTESDEEVHYEGCPNCRAILHKSHYFLKVCNCGQLLEV